MSSNLDEELFDPSIQKPHCVFCIVPAELCHQELEYCYIPIIDMELRARYQELHKSFPSQTRFHAWKESLCNGWLICPVCGLEGICPGCLPEISKKIHASEVWCEKHLLQSFLWWEYPK